MSGIELLQMIKNGKLKEGTKINVIKLDNIGYGYEYSIVTIITFIHNNLEWPAGTFRSSMLWDNNYLFEIVESKKVPNKISGEFQYSRLPSYFRDEEAINSVNCNFEQHQKAINELIDAVNYLLDTQNKN